MNQRINGIREITTTDLIAAGYTVTSDGDVISNKWGKRRVLKHGVLNTGHHVVNLRINGKSKLLLVHRLVALWYVSNPDAKPLVNHLDGDKSNNAASNLEWCTHAENIQHWYDSQTN